MLDEPVPHECAWCRQSDGISVDALAVHADKPVPKCLMAYPLAEQITGRAELVFNIGFRDVLTDGGNDITRAA